MYIDLDGNKSTSCQAAPLQAFQSEPPAFHALDITGYIIEMEHTSLN